MKALHSLTALYIIGGSVAAVIFLMAVLSFYYIYTSTGQDLQLTESLLSDREGLSSPRRHSLNDVIVDIEHVRQRAYILFVGALLLGLSGMAYLIKVYKKNIVDPLRNISSAAQHMMDGDFRTLDVAGGSEIRTLAENFNKMSRTLSEKIVELEDTIREKQNVVRTLNILNEFNSAILFKFNVEEVLETISSFSTTLIKAEMSSMILVDKLSREVTHYVSSLPEDHEEIINVTHKVIEEIISNGMPVRLNSVDDNERFREFVGKTPGRVRNFLAVPIMIGGDILGALILFNKANDETFVLDDEDTVLIVSFQGAIAIEKSLFHEEIVKLAKTDGLTGLNNHRTFHEEMEAEIRRARRLDKSFALLLVDIDDFKNFNDRFGHQQGDTALKDLSAILRRNVRSIDCAARYGGEEFTIILAETSAEGAVKTAERIRREIEARFLNVTGGVRLTVSTGISIFPDDAIDKEGLIKAADDALYMAKRMGRNRTVTFTQYKDETGKTR